MSRKQLEIQLSRIIDPFSEPNISYEQYQTPPRVAANLLHIAWTRDDIEDRHVVDLCAGTGILGLGAAILGAKVTLVELEERAFELLSSNSKKIDVEVELINTDVLQWSPDKSFDTAILNPPFGIQSMDVTDMMFIKKAAEVATEIYSIHDGSPANQDKLPELFNDLGLEIVEAYIEKFPIDNSYAWHRMKRKIQNVLIIHSTLS